MNEFDRRLKQQAPSARFSVERHENLVCSLDRAPARRAEMPLPSHGKAWIAATAVAILGVGSLVAWISVGNRSASFATRSNDPATSHDFGAPVRMTERSMTTAGDVAALLSADPTRPLFEPADHAFRFVMDQFSLAGSLAAPQKKPA